MTAPVSIIIPCYNAEPFLRETIDSTLRQTTPPLEVILVDDGSTDGSATIAESYPTPVKVLRQPNQGESVAMNAALAVARGDYIVFLGADDVLHPDLLTVQLAALRGRAGAVACTGFAFFRGETSKALPTVLPKADSFFPGIISANLGPPSCWMMPRERILQAGCFHGPQRYFEDWDLNWRVAMTGATYVPIPALGFFYRQHEKSQLASLANAERAYGHAWVMERMCRAFLERRDLLDAYGDTLFWSAMSALRACRAFGVPWQRLSLLSHMIAEVARRQPPGLRQSRFATMVRRMGTQRAEVVNSLWHRPTDAPVYRLQSPSGAAEVNRDGTQLSTSASNRPLSQPHAGPADRHEQVPDSPRSIVGQRRRQ